MKKRIALLLVLAFVLGLMVGFGEGQAPDESWGLTEATRVGEDQEETNMLLAEDWSGYDTPWPEGSYISDGGHEQPWAMISFMDDDCRAQTYEVLFRQVIEPLDLPYTLSLPIDKLDQSAYITSRELEEMLDAGVTIACHTLNETGMTDYDTESLNAMLTEWKDRAEDLGCGEVLSYAYCNGIWMDDAIGAVKANFRMGFTVDAGINQKPYESFYMKRVGLFARKTEEVTVELRDGTYLNANGKLVNGAAGERMTTQPIRVREGEEYALTCSAIWKGCCYVICNSAGQILDQYNVRDTQKGELLTDHRVRIPEGASYMIVAHNAAAYPGRSLSVRQLPGESTLAGAKEYVDRLVREGGWLVFMTHAWYDWFSAEDLIELVEYIREKNIPIVDVNEAIRTTGNVIEIGTVRKPLQYATGPYFVVSADGRVYTNSIVMPEISPYHENVALKLRTNRVLQGGKSVRTGDFGFVTCEAVDVTGCEAVLVTGWAYRVSDESSENFQVYVIKDAYGNVLEQYDAEHNYAEGGDPLDHVYVPLPEGAATITVAGNIYEVRPELTLIRSGD